MTPTHQEKFEDLEKLTNEQVGKFLTGLVQAAAGQISTALQFSISVIQTQSRELTLLRELETLIHELDSNPTDERTAQLYTRTDQVLAQLKLLREELARQNAPQSQPATEA